jgi:hypothetical protein
MAISAPTPVAAPSTTINVVNNTRIFNTVPSNPTNLVVPVARAVMNGAPGTSECMRRSLAILRAAQRSGLSDEDRAFLAGQAALAMEGAPLQVIVGESGEDVRQEELKPVISDMGKQLRRMDAATQNRQAAIKQLVQSRDGFSRGPERKQANAAYAQATRERKEAWKQLETDRQQVEIIILEKK